MADALSDIEAEFLIGYDALLQFLDDLQAVRPDCEARHMTVFSQTEEGWPLDRITTRLLGFMERILEAGADRHDFSSPGTLKRRAERRHDAIEKTWTNKGACLSVWEMLG